jgi:hypothetical protein
MALSQCTGQGCLGSNDGKTVTLGNGFLVVEIAADTGVMSAVKNRLTDERHALSGDQVCLAFKVRGAGPRTWTADAQHRRLFSVVLDNQPGHSSVRFVVKEADFAVSVEYELRSE